MTAETLSRRMQTLISSLERVAVLIKSMISGSRDFSKKNLGAQNCYNNKTDKFNFSSKGLNQRLNKDKKDYVEDSGIVPMPKYRKKLDKTIQKYKSYGSHI